ncbi:phage shock protein operon transcriptional activator [Desulfobaculum bizertense]|uniref:phage shock protein operon transcriptional activator n=1 Tax=Desulfobaculum bizertense TaxID=376490 RepID=UPI0032B7E38F
MRTASEQNMIGQSDSFLAFMEELSRAAKVNRPVLVVGERGTGKELAAQRLHFLSQRWQHPFLTLNCATLSPALADSELFGHETGAFTDARTRRLGRFERADSGTLFLDEIATLPLSIQEKLLRVVEYGEFDRVGGENAVSVDVRIIGATNTDLPHLAAKGEFRHDLLDRLSFEVLTIPPLRARQDDILVLAEHFALHMSLELGFDDLPRFQPSLQEQLLRYDWPGNVRELKNAIERAVYLSEGQPIEHVPLNPFASPYRPLPKQTDRSAKRTEPLRHSAPESPHIPASAPFKSFSLPKAIEEMERSSLLNALEANQFHQKRAAAALGLSYNQFRTLYRKHKATLTPTAPHN